ncbi:nitrite reductase [Alicyclobacillaceae bacterium I2511]|nr:nitrite reductase [Alicyclobacillaceae bacterium I2511]
MPPKVHLKQGSRAFAALTVVLGIASLTACAPNTKQSLPSTPIHTDTPSATHSGNAATSQNSFGSSESQPSSASMNPLNQLPYPMKFIRHGQYVSMDLYTEETVVQIAPGVNFPAWTFDGTVPGPVLYLRQGDHVTITLHNLDPNMPHSIDLHAAQVAPNLAFSDVWPGKSKTLTFVASLPGVFMYHCATPPMDLHIAQGMYGAVVVTPPNQAPPTYTLVQSEFYPPDDLQAVLSDQPNYVAFNGFANRYVDHPLPVKVNEPVTVAFVNAGPDEFSAFHVVGTILRDVNASGNPQNNLYDVQTYTVAPGDGMLVHLQFPQPGLYPFLSHAMNAYGKGAVGKFDVTN